MSRDYDRCLKQKRIVTQEFAEDSFSEKLQIISLIFLRRAPLRALIVRRGFLQG